MLRPPFFARLAQRSLQHQPPPLSGLLRSAGRSSPPRSSLNVPASTRNAVYLRFGQPGGSHNQKPPPRWPGWDPRNWDTRMRVIAALGVGGSGYYIAHLEQVPETGRWRFMNTSASAERKMGALAYDELTSEYKGRILSPTHPTARQIARVVTRILEANNLGALKSSHSSYPTPLEPFLNPGEELWTTDYSSDDRAASRSKDTEWNLIVVDDNKTVNAAAAYGNVIVFTGILPICQDEEGLAAVLGHEIGHVVARHNSERMSSAQLFFVLAQALDLVLGIDFGLSRVIMTFLLDLPNSRTQELEADRIGLRLAARACFRPEAAPEMFSRMGEMEKRQGSRLNVNWLYTHPTSESRVQALRGYLHEAYDIQAASDCGNTATQYGAFRSVYNAFRF